MLAKADSVYMCELSVIVNFSLLAGADWSSPQKTFFKDIISIINYTISPIKIHTSVIKYSEQKSTQHHNQTVDNDDHGPNNRNLRKTTNEIL